MLSEIAAPWYFLQREALFGAAYGLGFFFGFFIAALLNQPEPTYARLGDALPFLGVRGGQAVAVFLVIFGWAWRVWGASYLSSAVVWSDDLETGALHVAGPYRFSRNPLYFGNVAIALGVGMLGPPAATGLVLIFKIILILALVDVEERSLAKRYGALYQAYAERVPRLIPNFLRKTGSPGSPHLTEGLRSELMTGGFVVAMLVGYVTQRPLSLPVAIVFAVSIAVALLFVRRKTRATEVARNLK